MTRLACRGKYISRSLLAAVTVLRRRKLPFVLAAVVFAVTGAVNAENVRAQSGTSASGLTAAYDIPAQALDTALNTYIQVSGAQVFYETALTTGLRSAEVKGRFAPDAALRALLMGTGLVGRVTDVDAFSVIPATKLHAAAPVTAFARDSRFVNALQANVLKTLCGNSQTRPGSYKIAFELWMGPTGSVQSSALVGSTGDAARDAALIKALQAVAVDEALPIGMPQPIIMSIVARAPQETGDCAGQ
jgi:hypothetical protein